MQLMVLVSLFLNVIANRVLIAMFADRGRKVTVGPKLAAPKALFNDWAALEYFSCGYALQHGHYFSDTICRH